MLKFYHKNKKDAKAVYSMRQCEWLKICVEKWFHHKLRRKIGKYDMEEDLGSKTSDHSLSH